MNGTDNDGDVMSDELIVSALGATRNRIARHERERTQLDTILTAARQEERLLVDLLDLRRGKATQIEGRNDKPDGAPHPSVSVSGGRYQAVVAVIEELTAAGRPIHISDLMRLLVQRQVRVPGAGTQANLITHLRRDPQLVRPSRGMYALAAWGLENMTAGRRQRGRKRLRVKAIGRKGEK